MSEEKVDSVITFVDPVPTLGSLTNIFSTLLYVKEKLEPKLEGEIIIILSDDILYGYTRKESSKNIQEKLRQLTNLKSSRYLFSVYAYALKRLFEIPNDVEIGMMSDCISKLYNVTNENYVHYLKVRIPELSGYDGLESIFKTYIPNTEVVRILTVLAPLCILYYIHKNNYKRVQFVFMRSIAKGIIQNIQQEEIKSENDIENHFNELFKSLINKVMEVKDVYKDIKGKLSKEINIEFKIIDDILHYSERKGFLLSFDERSRPIPLKYLSDVISEEDYYKNEINDQIKHLCSIIKDYIKEKLSKNKKINYDIFNNNINVLEDLFNLDFKFLKML